MNPTDDVNAFTVAYVCASANFVRLTVRIPVEWREEWKRGATRKSSLLTVRRAFSGRYLSGENVDECIEIYGMYGYDKCVSGLRVCCSWRRPFKCRRAADISRFPPTLHPIYESATVFVFSWFSFCTSKFIHVIFVCLHDGGICLQNVTTIERHTAEVNLGPTTTTRSIIFLGYAFPVPLFLHWVYGARVNVE